MSGWEEDSTDWIIEREREDSRAALIRALTAQAWGVAIALHGYGLFGERRIAQSFDHDEVAALHAPADLAAEILGDK